MATKKQIEEFRKKLGARPSPWDQKRLKYALRLPTYEELQTIPTDDWDGLATYDKISDQGDIGSCTGFGAKGVKHVVEYLQNNRDVDISAAFLYRRGQEDAGIPIWEEGGYPLNVLKVMQKLGAATEACVPTDTKSPFDYEECGNSLEIAANYKIDTYHAVPVDPGAMMAAIYGITYEQPYKMPDGSSGKAPLYIAIPVYDSFMDTGSDGIISVPLPGESLLGGHAVRICGWRTIEGKKYWRMPNSWGVEWGKGGVGYLPFEHPIYEAWLITEGGLSPGPDPEPIPAPCLFSLAVVKLPGGKWFLRNYRRFRKAVFNIEPGIWPPA